MKFLPSLHTSAWLLAALAAAPGAMAQATTPTPHVMTDTAPLPASERQSSGAIVMEDSMVIAHRAAFQQAGARTGMASIGRHALRATLRAQTRSELADARAVEAAKFRDGGAATLEER